MKKLQEILNSFEAVIIEENIQNSGSASYSPTCITAFQCFMVNSVKISGISIIYVLWTSAFQDRCNPIIWGLVLILTSNGKNREHTAG